MTLFRKAGRRITARLPNQTTKELVALAAFGTGVLAVGAIGCGAAVVIGDYFSADANTGGLVTAGCWFTIGPAMAGGFMAAAWKPFLRQFTP
jgi:hypothetical protein